MDPSGNTSDSTYYSVYLSVTAAYFTALSIVLIFSESVSRFIPDSLNYFSGTTVASTYSPTSPTGVYSFHNASETNDGSIWPYVIPNASIASS